MCGFVLVDLKAQKVVDRGDRLGVARRSAYAPPHFHRPRSGGRFRVCRRKGRQADSHCVAVEPPRWLGVVVQRLAPGRYPSPVGGPWRAFWLLRPRPRRSVRSLQTKMTITAV
jgi:hypothetical protein